MMRLGLTIAILMLTPLAAQAQMATLGGAPEGFEQLDAPRATMIDLHYGGEPLGSFPAHTTPATVQFDDPSAIIAAIPAIKDKQAVHGVLAAPMPMHADRLCTQKRTEDCGELTPPVAGIIYNDSQLKGELFINPGMLAVVDANGKRYLPLPERNFSSVYGFNGAVNGVDTNSPVYAVTNNSIFSVGEARLATQTTMGSEGLRFDTAAASVERNGWNATGGLFPSHAMQLMADRDIAGVSIATSRKTVIDSKKSEGNAIILFLPRQSFVSIYREGRLYSSRSYEAGNQQIDTSELPEGAYDITLKIQEADGTAREERRFFVKSFDLPPPGEPTYYAQAGVMRAPASEDSALPELTSEPMVNLGTVHRLTDSTAIGASVMGLSDRATVETSLQWMEESLQTRAVVLGSTKGDFGFGGSALYSDQRFSAAIDARHLWLSDTPLPGYDDVTTGFTQVSGTASYAVSDTVTLGLRGSYSQQDDSPTTSSIGPYAQWRIWQSGESMLGLSADAARLDGKTQGNVFLSFSYRFGQNGVSSTLGSAFGQNNNGPLGSARIWHEDATPGNALRVGAGLSGDRANQAVTADADWRNQLGQFAGSVQKNFGTNSNFTYGGSFALGMAQANDDIRIGGTQGDGSAIMVDVSGDAKSDMTIYVNDMAQGTVKIGGRQVVYLSPFHIYHVRLVPVQPELLDYESSSRKVTLYPGNVAKLHWEVNKFYVVSARLQQPDGSPLVDALLEESRDEITTNSQGRLQAELSKPTHLTFTKADGGRCAVTLPQTAPVNGVLVYDRPLTCSPITEHAARH